MLPPSGTGPVEVTPEWLLEQQRAEQEGARTVAAPGAGSGSGGAQVPAQQSEQPPAKADVRAPVLPDPTAPPTEQLAHCERQIHEAKARYTAKAAQATAEFIDEAGPLLAWVHQHKLFKHMLDNTGKPYRSFPKYLKERHDLSKATGYRITQEIPLRRILVQAGYPLLELSVRQVAELHPIRTAQDNAEVGAANVVKVWTSALETSRGPVPTPDELRKAAELHGLSAKAVEDEDDEPRSLTAGPGAEVVLKQAAKRFVDADSVRAAVKANPEQARYLVRVLSAALTDAGVPVD